MRETMVAPPDVGRAQAKELIIAMGLGDISLFDRLQQCLAEGLPGIPHDELLTYMDDAAKAIDFLNSPVHDLGSGPAAIQHCDIKPHNLMIVGGAAQVCDFGLARMMGADRTTTAAATVAYAAPECLESGKPSDSTDQYSLAVSYYELKTGRLPYRDETLGAVIDAKRQGNLDFSQVTAARAGDSPPRHLARSAEAISVGPGDGSGAGTRVCRRPTRSQGQGQGLQSPHPRPDGCGDDHRRSALAVATLADASERSARRTGGDSARWFARRARRRPAMFRSFRSRRRSPATMWPTVRLTTGADQPTEATAPADVALANARRDYEQGQYQPAIDAFSEALRTRPADAEALLGRGRSHLAMKDFDPAIADLRQVLPERTEARAALAEAYLQRGLAATDAAEYDKAITDFQQAIQLDTDGSLGYRSREEYAAAYRQRGTAALMGGDFDRAIADLTAANEYNPQDAAVSTRLGGAYFRKGDYAKAVENYTAAIDLDDNDADYVNRGRAYLQDEKLDLAIGDFSKAIALNAQNAEAYIERGEAYMQQDDLDRAIADLDRAVELCQQDPKAKPQLETAYYYRANCQYPGRPQRCGRRRLHGHARPGRQHAAQPSRAVGRSGRCVRRRGPESEGGRLDRQGHRARAGQADRRRVPNAKSRLSGRQVVKPRQKKRLYCKVDLSVEETSSPRCRVPHRQLQCNVATKDRHGRATCVRDHTSTMCALRRRTAVVLEPAVVLHADLGVEERFFVRTQRRHRGDGQLRGLSQGEMQTAGDVQDVHAVVEVPDRTDPRIGGVSDPVRILHGRRIVQFDGRSDAFDPRRAGVAIDPAADLQIHQHQGLVLEHARGQPLVARRIVEDHRVAVGVEVQLSKRLDEQLVAGQPEPAQEGLEMVGVVLDPLGQLAVLEHPRVVARREDGGHAGGEQPALAPHQKLLEHQGDVAELRRRRRVGRTAVPGRPPTRGRTAPGLPGSRSCCRTSFPRRR